MNDEQQTSARLVELRRRADELEVASGEAVEVNRRILELDPQDPLAAMSLGRFQQDLNHLDDARDAFQRVIDSPRATDIARQIAQRRQAEVDKLCQRQRRPEQVGRNRDIENKPGELVLRTARKRWQCRGKGSPTVHAESCPVVIVPGTQYVEARWGRFGFVDESERFSLACATQLWNWRP